MKRSALLLLLLLETMINSPEVSLAATNWNWRDYSNSALLTEGGDFSLPWWWWFNQSRRPSSNAYLLMNHKDGTWISTTSNCAFNPNKDLGSKYVVVKNGVTYEYFVYSKVTLVAPGPIPYGSVVAQTKGPRITGGIALCGVRYFPPGVPIKVNLP